MSTDTALRHGIARTAGVVSSAAPVMVGMFSLFATASSLDLKQAGAGLAVAVLLDATVARGVLFARDHEAARQAQLVSAAAAGVVATRRA